MRGVSESYENDVQFIQTTERHSATKELRKNDWRPLNDREFAGKPAGFLRKKNRIELNARKLQDAEPGSTIVFWQMP
jgi:hypothetical protein